MAAYDSYKDSGVKWLGKVPSHWEILPGKAVFSENKVKNDNNTEKFVLSLSYGRIIPKKDLTEGLVPENYSAYQIVEPGYIIIRCTDLQNDKVSLRTGFVKNHGIISGAYLGLKTKSCFLSQYMHLLLHVWDITKELYRYGSGLRQSLSWNDIKYLNIPIPPREEQEAIVSYLDNVTAKIDEAIEAQQKMIDALNERKQIIITRAVTKGLNPDAPLRDSGIDWLGQIPAHWKVSAFRRYIQVLTDFTSNGSFADLAANVTYLDEPNYSRLIRLTDLRQNLNNKGVWIDKSSHNFLKNSELFGGELLMACVGAYAGYTCIMPKILEKASLAPNMFLIKTKIAFDEHFAKFYFDSIFDNLQNIAISSAQPKLNKQDVRSIKIIIPPLNEQRDIVEYINGHIVDLDKAISNCERMISLLQERKQIIINEVVTGKKKVI